jgi:outer membrane lipoprotein-sorting protein
MKITKILPYILLLLVLFFGGYQFKQHHDIKAAYSQLDHKYKALKNNSKQKVQKDAVKFLTAFYDYSGRPKKEQITGLTTKQVQDNLFQNYDQLDKKYEIPKNIDYKSEITNVTIYHARDEYDTKAKVLATFDSVITINGKQTSNKTIAEIELELVNKKWMVTKYQTLNNVYEFQGN